jgi:hypothetical protein
MMRMTYLRLLMFAGLVGLYWVSPLFGVMVLGAGFTYGLLRQRAQESVAGSFTTLFVDGSR